MQPKRYHYNLRNTSFPKTPHMIDRIEQNLLRNKIKIHSSLSVHLFLYFHLFLTSESRIGLQRDIHLKISLNLEGETSSVEILIGMSFESLDMTALHLMSQRARKPPHPQA